MYPQETPVWVRKCEACGNEKIYPYPDTSKPLPKEYFKVKCPKCRFGVMGYGTTKLMTEEQMNPIPECLKKFLRETDDAEARQIWDWLQNRRTSMTDIMRINSILDELWDSHDSLNEVPEGQEE